MSSNHPTKQILIDTTVTLLDEHPAERVTSELVLDVSKISKGSLYHHFPDFGHLTDEAQAIRFARSVDKSIIELSALLTLPLSPAELLDNLRKITRFTQSEGRANARSDRMYLLGLATQRPYLQSLLGAEQSRLNAALADIIRETQERGLVRRELDPLAVALLIQGYSLGLLLDDISAEPVSRDAWVSLIDALVENVILAKITTEN